MTLEVCAELVAEADPDRHQTTVLASEEVQRILWPLFAFNVEVTRAPWVTKEPMIAEIRLQWWRDALAEIREGQAVRSHAVTVPLAEILDAEGAMVLDRLVEARAWDIYSDPFPHIAAFDAYIDATFGALIWTAARLIGPADERVIRDFAYGCGVAAMLRAAPQLVARGRAPLPVSSVEEYRTLAETGAAALHKARAARARVPRTHDALMLSGWQAAPTYKAALQDPEKVMTQGLSQSEFIKRARLTKLGLFGWWR